MAQLVPRPWGRLRAARAVPAEAERKGIPAGMPQIPPLLTLAKFSAFSKQFPHLRKKPHTTQPQTKTNKKPPARIHVRIENHWTRLVPICPLPLGRATTLLSPLGRGPQPVGV